MALIKTFDKTKLVEVSKGQNQGVIRTYKKSCDICSCDICGIEYEQRTVDTKHRRTGTVSNGRDLCKTCTSIAAKKFFAEVGTIALSKISKSDRKKNASTAGTVSAANYDPSKNKSRFSTERWNEKTEEEKHFHVMRASNGLQEKLKDPVLAAQHYAKVFAQTKIGYQSKGHKDLHNLIEHLGFISHVQIGRMQVDECNEKHKIVIEYNGDMWHCNPKKWKAEDYNSAIRMTAGEKWQKDIARHKALEKLGYRTLIIWETGWQENAQKYIDRIKELCNETKIKNLD